jgi:hypothetical protein
VAAEISEENSEKGGDDKKSDPAIERLQIYVGLAKFLIGTVAIGALTLVFNERYRDAQLALEGAKNEHAVALQESRAEVEYLSTFVANAMVKDLKNRVAFADYMKSVALSLKLQKIWSSYYVAVKKNAEDEAEKIEQLNAQKRAAGKQLALLELPTNKAAAKEIVDQLQGIDRDLYLAQEKLDVERYGTFKENYLDYQSVMDDANTAQKAGNYSRQRDLLLGVVDRVPRTVKPYFQAQLADAYRSLHDFANARLAMQDAVDLAPTAANLAGLAIMEKNDHRLDLALKSLDKAAELSQGQLRTDIELMTAGYLIHNGQRNEGLQRFAELEPRLQPRDHFITNIAWFNAVADRKAEFYQAFERALEVNRQETLVWIVQEVDIDKYRNEERFKELVRRARAG